MAKTRIPLLLLLSVLLLVVAEDHQAAAAEAAATEAPLSPAAEKSVKSINDEMQKILDLVVAGVPPPPAKQMETMHAALQHLHPLNNALKKAKASGDEKRLEHLLLTAEIAATMIEAAPQEKKLQTLEEAFRSVATPNVLDCPASDKAFCEMEAKIQRAYEETGKAAPVDKKMEVKATILKTVGVPARSAVDSAYTSGDEKKIAQVLAAYSEAADAVIAAAPADKLKVMEKTFADATAASAAKP